jgi:DnaJ-class molecular chaperone
MIAPECNGHGAWPFEETERCTRCGGSGLVMVADEREQDADGHQARRFGRVE